MLSERDRELAEALEAATQRYCDERMQQFETNFRQMLGLPDGTGTTHWIDGFVVAERVWLRYKHEIERANRLEQKCRDLEAALRIMGRPDRA